MRILYCNVIEQNAPWGAECFVNRALRDLGHTTTCVDFREHRSDLNRHLAEAGDYEAFLLQRGDGVSRETVRAQRQPRLYWASELLSRCRDQDDLLSSRLFDHVFFHSHACLATAVSNGWVATERASVLLNGFDTDAFYPLDEIVQDIDVLFVGSLTERRQRWLEALQRRFPIVVASAYGSAMAELIRRSRIVLNLHADEPLDTETRVFEVLGCGGFLMSEPLSDENPFDDRHFVTCRGLEGFYQHLEFYLGNESERRRIAAVGHAEAIAKHTYLHRARTIAEVMHRLLNHTVKAAHNGSPRRSPLSTLARRFTRNTTLTELCETSHWLAAPAEQVAYLSLCHRAAEGVDFESFKRQAAYCRILEHLNEEQGARLFAFIQEHFPWLEPWYPRFRENDRWGDPITYQYGQWKLSPTTIRYIKVLGDLVLLFGDLNGLRIVEIGGGYGGQCKILFDVFRPAEYVLIDLEAVTRLQQEYLRRLGVTSVRFLVPDQVHAMSADLVISNFALSELSQGARSFYESQVLANAARGYVTWNGPGTVECLSRRAHVIELPEIPQTGPNNRILVWGSPALMQRASDFAALLGA